MRSTKFRAAFAAAGVCTLTAMTAQAQTAAGDDLTEIVITGSRVIANGNDAPTPVTVLMPEQVLATKPTTLYENLIDMPVFSGSRGAANGPVGNSSNGQGAVSTLNLRNMGAQRNLVLFDGRRVPAATADGLVDVTGLPQMLIQRVDVVTGGVSAVYGSDAITGVTNFITDTKFNGAKINLQRGISAQNDDASYEIGLAFGHELFGGRGHIEASYQRQSDEGLYDVQRDWTKPRWTVQGDGKTVPWHLVDYAANATASYGGAIACPNGTLNPANCAGVPLVGQSFNQNGVLSPYNFGLTGVSNGIVGTAVQIGGDGVYFNNVALKSQTRRDQFYARFDYDVTDNIHADIAASGGANYVTGNTGVQRSFPPGWKLGACNPFLSSQYQTALGCTALNKGTAAEPSFYFEKAIDPGMNYGAGQNNRLSSHNYFVLAGLEGKFGDGYRWDATYTHSQNKMIVSAMNQNRDHIFAQIDAVINPANGQVVCNSTLTNPGVHPGCVPVNLFGPTAVSQDAIAYMFDTIQNTTQNKLDGLAGSITGAPLNDWAGPINMNLSAELRKLTMDLATTSRPDEFVNCTGLRFGNCNSSTQVHANSWLPISGVNQKITEAAYELNMPLIKDTSVFKDVNFNGAVRYTTYKNDPNDAAGVSRTFNATPWKAGIVWDMPGDVTLRWARSKDIRAPSLYDLYLPITAGPGGFAFDYLQPGNPQIPGVSPKSGGNPYLDPEVGHTTTLGIVYRPTPNFSLALDAYRITLTNALYSLNGASPPIQQACYASGGSSPLCQLQERPKGCCSDNSAANGVTAFYTRFVNIAQQKTSGIDLESSFNTRLFDRALSLRLLTTYQPHILYTIPNLPLQDTAGVAYPQFAGGLGPAPVWKASLFVQYKVSDRWTVNLAQRYRSHLHWASGRALFTDPDVLEVGGVPAVTYTNATVSYDLPTQTKINVFFNVQNLFDKEPPPAGTLAATFPGSFPGTYATGDDVVGRYFVLGLRARL